MALPERPSSMILPGNLIWGWISAQKFGECQIIHSFHSPAISRRTRLKVAAIAPARPELEGAIVDGSRLYLQMYLCHLKLSVYSTILSKKKRVYRDGLKYVSQVLWKWCETIMFSCLLQADERNFSPPIHRTWEAYFCPSLYVAYVVPDKANCTPVTPSKKYIDIVGSRVLLLLGARRHNARKSMQEKMHSHCDTVGSSANRAFATCIRLTISYREGNLCPSSLL